MRLIIKPIFDRTQEIDVTQRVVATIAHEIWTRFGGCDALNWLEAEGHVAALESHLAALIEQIRDDRSLAAVLPASGDDTSCRGMKCDQDIRQELGSVENGHESSCPPDTQHREPAHRTDRTKKRRPARPRRRVAVSA